MALKKLIEYKGISVKNAYIRVWKVECTKEKMSFGVSFSAAPEAEFFYSATMNADYDIEGDNPIRQAYIFLKLQPEFADAEDC